MAICHKFVAISGQFAAAFCKFLQFVANMWPICGNEWQLGGKLVANSSQLVTKLGKRGTILCKNMHYKTERQNWTKTEIVAKLVRQRKTQKGSKRSLNRGQTDHKLGKKKVRTEQRQRQTQRENKSKKRSKNLDLSFVCCDEKRLGVWTPKKMSAT